MPRMISFEYLMKLISVSYVFHLLASGEKVQKSEVAKLYGRRIGYLLLACWQFFYLPRIILNEISFEK